LYNSKMQKDIYYLKVQQIPTGIIVAETVSNFSKGFSYKNKYI